MEQFDIWQLLKKKERERKEKEDAGWEEQGRKEGIGALASYVLTSQRDPS